MTTAVDYCPHEQPGDRLINQSQYTQRLTAAPNTAKQLRRRQSRLLTSPIHLPTLPTHPQNMHPFPPFSPLYQRIRLLPTIPHTTSTSPSRPAAKLLPVVFPLLLAS
ncbi:unnamed protein product [Hydatigera taeniaeformis]|uniref:Uncharacterized protein n=1 Tax=Hydatigena taeniaeformis TaxID=6205 RepID=A0A3P7FF77_HYDTA|nr:unnamed protein product [Hydatigera taeniaeformis]